MDREMDQRISGKKTNNQLINGMLYQRKIQKLTELAKKKRAARALLERKQKQFETEKSHLMETGNSIQKKQLSFYDQVFQRGDSEEREDERPKKNFARANKGPMKQDRRPHSPKGASGNFRPTKINQHQNPRQELKQKTETDGKKPFDGSKNSTREEIQKKIEKRKQRAKQFTKVNGKGQPIMKHRINDLFAKIKGTVNQSQ